MARAHLGDGPGRWNPKDVIYEYALGHAAVESEGIRSGYVISWCPLHAQHVHEAVTYLRHEIQRVAITAVHWFCARIITPTKYS